MSLAQQDPIRIASDDQITRQTATDTAQREESQPDSNSGGVDTAGVPIQPASRSLDTKLDVESNAAAKTDEASETLQSYYHRPTQLYTRLSRTTPTRSPAGTSTNESTAASSHTAEKQDDNPEWNHTHPCYPHDNVYVPVSSSTYLATRLIRIPRDWTVAGDVAPTFSNTYPEVLEPWVSEAQFRQLVTGINEQTIAAFSPLEGPGRWRVLLDGVLSVMTGWLWDDAGMTGTKRKLRALEQWIEQWNESVRKDYMLMGGEGSEARHLVKTGRDGTRFGTELGNEAEMIKTIPLWRSAYLTLDIQIPTPDLGLSDDGESQLEPRTRGMAKIMEEPRDEE